MWCVPIPLRTHTLCLSLSLSTRNSLSLYVCSVLWRMSVAVLTDWAQEPTITYKVVGEASKEATATVPAGFLIEARNEKGNLHPDDGKQKLEVSRHYFSLIYYSFFFLLAVFWLLWIFVFSCQTNVSGRSGSWARA